MAISKTAKNGGANFGFAEETLALLSGFLADARHVEATVREKFGHAET